MADNTPTLMTNQVERIYVTRGCEDAKGKGDNRSKNLGFLINNKIYWQFSLFDKIIEMNNEVAYLNIRFDETGRWGYVDENGGAVIDKQVTQISETNELLFSASSKYAKAIARKNGQYDSFKEDYLWGISEIQADYIGIKHYNGRELADILKEWLAKTDINDMHFFVTRSDEKDRVEASFVMPLDAGTQLNFLVEAKQRHLGNETTKDGVIKTYELTDFDISYFHYNNQEMGINLLQRHKFMSDPYPLYSVLNDRFSQTKRYESYNEDGKITAVRYSNDRIGDTTTV